MVTPTPASVGLALKLFPRPNLCANGHLGPLTGTAKFDAHPDPIWWNMGTCSECGSTIHRDQLRAV